MRRHRITTIQAGSHIGTAATLSQTIANQP